MPSATEHANSKLDPAELADEVRIAMIRTDRWVHYERAQKVLAYLEDLLDYPPRDRMPCLLIYGVTGMGKTKIVGKFMRDHPDAVDSGVGVMRKPVVYVQMPPFPDELAFFDEVLRAIGSPSLTGSTGKRTRETVRNLLTRCETKMIIIDELHSMLAGTPRMQRVMLNTLRFIANDLKIPIVCVGTEDARVALQMDAQLAERFDAFELPRWKDDAAFRRLLVSITGWLPLRQKPQLDVPSCRKHILELTEGVTNRIFRLLEVAAVKAIQDGREIITEEDLRVGDLMLPLVSSRIERR